MLAIAATTPQLGADLINPEALIIPASAVKSKGEQRSRKLKMPFAGVELKISQ